MKGAATQIAAREFDTDFFHLPAQEQAFIQGKIDDMGMWLGKFQHYRMTGSDRCRLRAGNYRVIYRFDVAKNEIYLLAVGDRREIYRS